MERYEEESDDPAALADPHPLGELLAGCVQTLGHKSKGVSAGWAWNQIAGPRGRAHTRGVFLQLQPPKLPLLRVYLDSSVLIQDFSTDHLLFERRLVEVGLPVERVVFQLSRSVGSSSQSTASEGAGFSGRNAAEKTSASQPVPYESLPPLTEAQKQRIAQLTAGLEGELKAAAMQAMEASVRRAQRKS